MKNLPLVLLASLALLTDAQASDPCSKKLNQFIHTQPDESGRNSAFPEYGASPYDLDRRTEEALRSAALLDTQKLLVCNDGQEGVCLIPKKEGDWIKLDATGPTALATEREPGRIKMRQSWHHSTQGDPWYGIGASHWTNELRLSLDLSTLTMSQVFLDGENTILGIKSKTRSQSSCSWLETARLVAPLRKQLKQDLFAALAGKPDAIRGPVDLNYLQNESGSRFQITRLIPETGQVDLLNLESGHTSTVAVESLAQLKTLNVAWIISDVRRFFRSPDADWFGAHSKSWQCIQGPNSLINPHQEPRDVRHKGYTEIAITPAKRGPGEDLGYRPLTRITITRQGWEGTYSPATLPFGQTTSVVVADHSGNAQFIAAGRNGMNASNLRVMDADLASKRYGIQADLLHWEGILCFRR
jgi:hypothetical protein